MPTNIPVDQRTWPSVPEKDIQRAILHYLQIRGYVCRRTNVGAMGGEYKGKKWFMRFGEAGLPDIEGMTKEGIYFGIEVKRKGKLPTDSQKSYGERVLNSKGIWFVAWDVADVIARGF